MATPYKFLDYYDFSDASLYFGRKHETEILLSDIITTRLVVLFAKTGCGKTSLINAGIRPRLEELNYITFFIRVKKNPIESAREVLRNKDLLPTEMEGQSLENQLKDVVNKLRKPVVLFFDQFEEFFMYIKDPERTQFITDIARIYRRRELGVHIVFSMREEFLFEMDAFRDEIPSIFHNDSNLRLRPFNDLQAEVAIVKPAQIFGVEIEKTLVDKLIADLRNLGGDGIEPAHLQILCDTLWQERKQGRILLKDYERLEGAKKILDRRFVKDIEKELEYSLEWDEIPGKDGDRLIQYLEQNFHIVWVRIAIFEKTDENNTVKLSSEKNNLTLSLNDKRTSLNIKIDDGRTDIFTAKIENDRVKIYIFDIEQLRLLKKLLPELRFPEKDTKYPRGLDELVKTLETDSITLNNLIDKLEKMRLVRRNLYHDTIFIEWTSDYLAASTDKITWRLMLMYSMRKKAELEKQQMPDGSRWFDSLTKENLEIIYLTFKDYEEISEITLKKGVTPFGELNTFEAQFLLEAALYHGTKHMHLWFDKASQNGVDVWPILEDMVNNSEEQNKKQIENSIELMGQLIDKPKAAHLLEVVMFQPGWGLKTLDVLGQIQNEIAIRLLQSALKKEALASDAIGKLRRMRTIEAIEVLENAMRQGGVLALQAGKALDMIATDLPGFVSVRSSEVLSEVLAKDAQSLFITSLETGLDMPFWFEKAKANQVDVWTILRENTVNENVPPEKGKNIVRLLGMLGSIQAFELMKIAFEKETLADITSKVLDQLETMEVVDFWESMLQKENFNAKAQNAFKKILESKTAQAIVKDKAQLILNNWNKDQGKPIGQIRITPIVAPQIRPEYGNVLEEKDWDLLLKRIKDRKCTPLLGAGAEYPVIPLGYSIAMEWARNYNYPFEDSYDLSRVAQFLAVDRDPMFPTEEIVKLFKTVKPPDFTKPYEIHSILADLPLPIYLTTNYDDFMVKALKSRNKNPIREFCRWSKRIQNQFKDKPSIFESENPTIANPVVFHLHGNNDVPESLVLTEDDYLDFLVNISNDHDLLPPKIREVLSGTSLLFLGYSIKDWDFRVIFRSLVSYLERSVSRAHIIVMLLPDVGNVPDEQKAKAQQYLDRYFWELRIKVYWGTCQDFAADLRKRWEVFNHGT